jgi:hypothetical protein
LQSVYQQKSGVLLDNFKQAPMGVAPGWYEAAPSALKPPQSINV